MTLLGDQAGERRPPLPQAVLSPWRKGPAEDGKEGGPSVSTGTTFPFLLRGLGAGWQAILSLMTYKMDWPFNWAPSAPSLAEELTQGHPGSFCGIKIHVLWQDKENLNIKVLYPQASSLPALCIVCLHYAPTRPPPSAGKPAQHSPGINKTVP